MTETPLRILMLAPTPYFSDRGCHVRIFEEAKTLILAGHDVRIVTYHLGKDMPGIIVDRIPTIPWYQRLEAGPSWHKPYLDILLLMKAIFVARTFKPHLIHAHLHEGALIGAILKKILHIPLLFDYQGSLSGESLSHGFFQQNSLLHRCFATVESCINSTADFIITSSGAGRGELTRQWGVPPDMVEILMDGVDTEIFRPYPRNEARRELGIQDETPVVVYLGLMSGYQGVDLLMEAMKLIRLELPDVRLLLMGFPEEEYRRKAVDMAIDDIIIFTGRVPYDRAPILLSAGDLAVSPKISRTEANGKLFNYIACGLPVVVFDSEINREILGDDGVYADFGEVNSLAASIINTLSDAVVRFELGKRCRNRAVRVHSWNKRTDRLIAIYRKLLSTDAKGDA